MGKKKGKGNKGGDGDASKGPQHPPQQQPQQPAPQRGAGDSQAQKGPGPSGVQQQQQFAGKQQSGSQQPQSQGQQPQKSAWGQKGQQQPQTGPPPGLQAQGQGQQPQQPPWGQRGQPQPQTGPPPGLQAQGQGQQPQQSAWGQRGQQQQPQTGPPPGWQAQQQQPQGQGRGQKGPQGMGRGQGRAETTPTPPGSYHSTSPKPDSPVSPQGPPPGKSQQAQKQGQQQQQQQQQKKKQGGQGAPSKPLAAGAGDKKALEAELNKQFQDMKLKPQEKQIKPGTRGRPIPLESNHLTLSIGKLASAFHYDVDINPDLPKKALPLILEAFRKQHFPQVYVGFDGRKNLYSAKMLPFGQAIQGEVKLKMERGDKEYKVAIKLAREVDLSPLHNLKLTVQNPMDALTVVDIVLKSAPSRACINVGRSFFHKPAQIIDLGDGMEMYNGYYQSAIRGWKLLLNVDVAHKAFPKAINVIDLICELGSTWRDKLERKSLSQPLRRDLLETLRKYISKLKIVYEIKNQPGTRRTYGVNGLGDPPNVATFKSDTGQVMTVMDYFKNEKRTHLQYPNMPTLWVGPTTRKILLPVEMCTVQEGQAIKRKMNENQTSNMIKVAATNTAMRKQKIMDGVNKASYNTDPVIKAFGFSVGNKFEEMQGRVLNPPVLEYAENRRTQPQKGVWRSGGKFFTSVTIKKWTIAVADRYMPKNLNQFAEMIVGSTRESGIVMGRPTEPYVQMGRRQDKDDIINYFKRNNDFDIIFVVVPNSGPQYSYVKSASEINVGCLTQCIKARTLNKLNAQTVGNIMLKVNSKLTGVNHFLHARPPIMNRPCMIIGADVTHPSPDATETPSVAAVVASHDPKAFQYNICWRLQDPRTEVIQDLENIMKEQLMFFYQKTRCKPEKIVFFRDGVGEGQFDEIRNVEIGAIRKACLSMGDKGEYQPPITFVIVQKRHHTRLFPKNPRDSEDRNTNVPAGTCVDHTITNPMMQDFYLVSHASIQGVAKPTKYCTIWDDNDFSNDDIEELAYYLCHMFTRCNRSVSYGPPTTRIWPRPGPRSTSRTIGST
ncbi:unnamed protein product [Brassicogethes aeneus]|uniref:Uncharacterized protein n=1 Tax=Brassicogethes aeneus TaxID=1431903 RepID=A0A9P0B9L8_BRAAE|nr:unnamed protein product [Brassicogethes aeneus]CAH0557928.1 unnamed protein product [Brassicogethes aeneus]